MKQMAVEKAGELEAVVAQAIAAGETRVELVRDGAVIGEVTLTAAPAPQGGFDFEALRRWKEARGIGRIITWISPDLDDELPEDFLITPQAH